ncbi:MAG: R3H domain-containing nucleic acid-binding protein [Candidatus Sericytochromatia bacterium]|nr:R3H domain-containing nucleic acid-binding protein [Candidatus Sericytochromatia bacterium]
MEFTEEAVEVSQETILDAALDFLAELVGAMDLAADIAIVSETDEQITIRIDSDEDAGVLIGRKGQTLQSVQYLLNVLFGTRLDRRINVDVGDYRARHEEKLLEDAHAAAERVLESGKRFALEPMTPADRRTVHHLISEQYPDLQTYSTGEEPTRRIVIEPKGATGPRPGEIGRWGGGRSRDPRNFDGRRGGAYHSRRPR